jgi:hypothetical protein
VLSGLAPTATPPGGSGPDRDRKAARGRVADEVWLAVVGDDHLDVSGEGAGRAQHLALERGRGVDRDGAAGGDVDLEQPGDRLVQGYRRPRWR